MNTYQSIIFQKFNFYSLGVSVCLNAQQPYVSMNYCYGRGGSMFSAAAAFRRCQLRIELGL